MAKQVVIYNGTALQDGAGTDRVVTEIAVDSAIPLHREFIISGRIVSGTVAPGAARTVTINMYWSDTKLSTAEQAAIATTHANRKTAGTAKAVPAGASGRLDHEFQGTIQRIRAPYLYITFDQTAQDAGSAAQLYANFDRVPSSALDL